MDAQLFRFINETLTNPVFDSFFPWFTDFQKTSVFHFFLLPVILIATFWFFKWRGIALLALGALFTWGADVVCNHAIKPLFNRPRPFQVLTDAIVRIPRPGSSSFPSGHTFDAFFFATFLALIYPRLSWLYFALALLIAVSRVYLGVHYPGDAFGGAVIGSALAYCLVTLYRLAVSKEKPV